MLESGLGENFIYNKQLIDEAVRDINKIDFLRSNPNPRLFMLSRPEKARLDFLLTELNTNTFYGAISYSPEEKLFFGDALLIIKNIYGNGHSFKILWKRIDEDKTLWQGEIKLTWLFSKPVDFKINISYKRDISYSHILTRSILSYFKNNWEFYTGIEYINVKHSSYTLEQFDNMSGLFLDTRDFPVNPTSGLLFNFEVKTGQTNYNTMKNINTYIHISLIDYFSFSKFVFLFSSGFSGLFSSNYIEDILLSYGGDNGPRGYLPESFKTDKAILNTVETRYIISKYNNIFIFFDCLLHNNSGSTFTDIGYGFGMMTGGDNVSVKAYISANPEIKDFSSILLSTQLEYNF